MQLPLFEPPCEWKPPVLGDLPSWREAKRVAIDVETRDDHIKTLDIGNRRGGYICGYSFAIEDGPKHYVPIRHAGGDNVDAAQAMQYLRDQFKDFTGDIVGANLSYDLDYLWDEGIDTSRVRYFRDIQIADPLIYELHFSYSLKNIAQRYGFAGKREDTLREAAQAYGVDPKGGLWKLPGRFVGEYGEGDVDEPLKILRRQERLIDEKDLWDIYNLESQVLPVLVRMRRRGVRINLQRLEQIETWSLTQEGEALARVKQDTGVNIAVGDVWKAGAVAPALHALGVDLPKTDQGKDSIKKDILAEIDHPVARAIAWARKVNKLRTTFAASVRKYEVDGRIHCTFNQIARETEGGDQKGARYGRLSCTDPNLQQQPARDEFSKDWRKIYEPEEGTLWCSNDYSQQEPRWTTHFSCIAKPGGLPGALEAAKAYHDDPLLDNHTFMAELTGLPRKFAKNIYLGLCYGEGGAKLCRDVGKPTRWALASGRGRDRRVDYFLDRQDAMRARAEKGDGYVFETAGEEGQQIIDTFDQRAPFIKMLAKQAEDTVKKRGYIITGGGRKLNFEQNADGSYEWTHKALNRLIQGTSADQVKKALVALDAEGYHVMLQVHDEICSSVKTEEEGKAQAEIMRDIMPAKVPFRVDTEIGASWGDSMS